MELGDTKNPRERRTKRNSMKIYDLKTNYQKNAIGIDLEGITLSWKVREAGGHFQKTVQIRIAEDDNFKHCCYTSGELALAECYYMPKVKLSPGRRYCWQVTVTDDTGDSAVSDTAYFEGGHPAEDWYGEWITAPFSTEIHPLFQKTFTLEEARLAEMTARMYICGLGLYEVYLNGKKVGDEYLTPYFTDYRYWIQYQTYDVGGLLKAGENRIDVYMGNGWYMGKFGYLNKGQLRNYYGAQMQLLLDLYLWEGGSAPKVIASGTDWLALKSPVIISGIYDGEMYDARMEQSIEKVPPRLQLYAVRTEAPAGKLSAMVGTAVKRHEILKVKEIITTRTGETILDFGQEITGWVAFYGSGPEGRRVILQYGEVLQDGVFYRDNLRTARAEYTFIANGKRQFTRPHFTFYGFRYVKVTGMRVDASNVDDFEAWTLYSDLAETGWVETSHEKVNRLIQNTKWSQKDNFLDIPTDCPQRDERLGWTGDAQIFSGTACFHMQTPTFFRKYLRDMCVEQWEKRGAVPYVVPDVLTLGRIKNGEPEFDLSENVWGEAGASVWGDAATVIPWNLYLFYGNRGFLSEQYDNMKQWVDFIIHMDRVYCGAKRLWTCGFHFGDWLSLDVEGDNRTGGTDCYLVASIYYMHSAGLTAKAASVLGKHEEAEYYSEISAAVREAVRTKYVQADGTLTVHTQTAYALGICFQIFEESEMKMAAGHLKELLQNNNNHLSTGFVGTAYLCRALSQVGLTSMAYDLLFNEDYPGWLYEVNLGATTIWERWNSLLEDGSISSTGMNSLNHYAYGVIMEWIYRMVCGLNPLEEAPGFRKVRIAPQPDRRLQFARAEYESVYGTYRVEWQWTGDGIRYDITVPFGCEAEFLPDKTYAGIIVNGREEQADRPVGKLLCGVHCIKCKN
mgnify:CR=1